MFIEKCTFQFGFELKPNFLYTDPQTGDICSAPLPDVTGGRGVLPLDEAMADPDGTLNRYLDAVLELVRQHNNEFGYRHLLLHITIVDAATGQPLLVMPTMQSIDRLRSLLNGIMNEADPTFKYCYGDCYFGLSSDTMMRTMKVRLENRTALATAHTDEQWETVTVFDTPTRPFINALWHELLRAERFTASISRRYSNSNENLWESGYNSHDDRLWRRNRMSAIIQLHSSLEKTEEGKYFAPSRTYTIAIGYVIKGVFRPGLDLIGYNDDGQMVQCKIVKIEDHPGHTVDEATNANPDHSFAFFVEGCSAKRLNAVDELMIPKTADEPATPPPPPTTNETETKSKSETETKRKRTARPKRPRYYRYLPPRLRNPRRNRKRPTRQSRSSNPPRK